MDRKKVNKIINIGCKLGNEYSISYVNLSNKGWIHFDLWKTCKDHKSVVRHYTIGFAIGFIGVSSITKTNIRHEYYKHHIGEEGAKDAY